MRQAKIDQRLLRANAKRKPHDWRVGEMVLVKNSFSSGDKLKEPSFRGLYPIIKVHTNGNVTIRQPQGIEEHINIRLIKHFRQATGSLAISILPGKGE